MSRPARSRQIGEKLAKLHSKLKSPCADARVAGPSSSQIKCGARIGGRGSMRPRNLARSGPSTIQHRRRNAALWGITRRTQHQRRMTKVTRLCRIATIRTPAVLGPLQVDRSAWGARTPDQELTGIKGGAPARKHKSRMRIGAFRLGIVVGVVVAAMHAAWAAMVALNWAQPFLDFIFRLHFVTPPYHVEPFSMTTAGALVGLTGAIGFLVGAVFAIAWNACHPTDKSKPGAS